MNSDNTMSSPEIALFDCDEKIVSEIKKNNFYFKKGSFGEKIKIEYSRFYPNRMLVNLNHSFIPNLHEFEIFVFDMEVKESSEVCAKDMTPQDHGIQIRIDYPLTIFYPSIVTSELLKTNFPSRGVYLVFSGPLLDTKYRWIQVDNENHSEGQTYTNNYSYLPCFPSCKTKSGLHTNVLDTHFKNILHKYEDNFFYYAIFEHPYTFKSGVKLYDENFIPIMANKDNEIIGYHQIDGDNHIIMLPQTDNKAELLIDLLTSLLPVHFPKLFPELTRFNWLHDERLLLPNEKGLLGEKKQREEEYLGIIHELDNRINVNRQKFSYLHELLNSNGNTLVKAVINFLKSIDFEEVIDIDESTSEKQEDINAKFDDTLLIIEVKGIGGTSTDSDCTQIGKHRRRLEKLNRGMTIHPLYIVNHQMYLPPWSRQETPFTKEQIEYAENDERGLVTTWTLYQWHNLIEANIFSKKEIKESLCQIGCVSTLPTGYTCLGIIEEYFGESNAFILEINNIQLSIGDILVFSKNSTWIKAFITSIQINGKNVESAENGELGIVVSEIIGRKYKVYYKNTQNTAGGQQDHSEKKS